MTEMQNVHFTGETSDLEDVFDIVSYAYDRLGAYLNDEQQRWSSVPEENRESKNRQELQLILQPLETAVAIIKGEPNSHYYPMIVDSQERQEVQERFLQRMLNINEAARKQALRDGQ